MFQFRVQEALAVSKPTPALDWACAIGFPLVAALLFLLSTHHGIGIYPDSTRYMGLAARPWDAPLYPALLQLVAATGIDIATGAWGIGLALCALNALLTWAILREASGRATYAALGTALVVIAPQTAGKNLAIFLAPVKERQIKEGQLAGRNRLCRYVVLMPIRSVRGWYRSHWGLSVKRASGGGIRTTCFSTGRSGSYMYFGLASRKSWVCTMTAAGCRNAMA